MTELERLKWELAHVNEQCQVAHAMAMSWRQRCQAAEEKCERLQRKLDRRLGTRSTAEAQRASA
jgi:hypothetical protein